MVDDAALWETFGAGMVLVVKLVPETSGALPPMGIGEGQELTCHEIAGMRGYDVEETGFCFGVAEGPECIDMDRGDVHGTMIRAQLFGFVERTARPRRAYPGRETGFATGRLPCSDTQRSGVTDEVGRLRRA